MPAERISKSFKDISMSFKINPINFDLIEIKNETSISRSIRNLVLTSKGERFFNEGLGSGIQNLLFENVDDVYSSLVEDSIRETIEIYEPRVKLGEVRVFANYDNNEYDVIINYEIIGTNVSQQQLSFALQSSR